MRRAGLSLCEVSRRLSGLVGGVLSQVGLMGRVLGSADLECLGGVALDEADRLAEPRRGAWMVEGWTLRRPKRILAWYTHSDSPAT